MVIELDEVRRWIAANARPVDALAELVGDAVVVGMGESTRAGHEVMRAAEGIVRRLVAEKGFRALAIQDDETVFGGLDAYVRTGEGDPRKLLADAWRPWQNEELLDVVEWIRGFNAEHPDDPVRIFGLTPPAARLADYDEVARHVRAAAPDRLDELLAHYTPIRTAHEVGEHVQIARGTHPGRPFVEHAREARELVGALRIGARVRELADLIVDFHANSVAGGLDFDAAAAAAAEALVGVQERTGHKIVYWEGIAHIANSPAVDLPAMGKKLRGVGSRLRAHFGAAYRNVAIGFGHGRIHYDTVPPAPPEFVDAVLSETPEPYLLDLHAARPPQVAEWLRGPHKMRIIAGIYDSAHDTEHHMATGPLDEWFDALVRIPEITPTTPLARP
ncbi:erythromycin esterase family protein [Pseudonocardia sp. TRM90224]|uniref:erythromycin esterase family protein n=1 Tax=Pseudonocardia sp. TRM90224 TaxID=2812678 RepID=UPI001E2B489D|nr:erythromycin esterase family protein [Pseudonocardia sp. TRM90224]